jgi:hypothetical protein
MRLVIFLASSLTVCGFYLYVLAQLYREEQRLNAHKKGLQEHLREMEPETSDARAKRVVKTAKSRIALRNHGTLRDYERSGFHSAAAAAMESNAEAKARRETVISLVLGVGGLTALFAGIEFFNSLVNWAHSH